MKTKQYIGIGSNVGNRQALIEAALSRLSQLSSHLRFSPVYETAALLPKEANDSWNQPFLNLVAEIEFEGDPRQLLYQLKSIENELGRTNSPRWAPRIIDLDILLWGDRKIDQDDLQIPHPELENRAFVLDPLKDLNPDFTEKARQHPHHSPLWMAIFNITPDSFSDGGQLAPFENFQKHVQLCTSLGVQILDLGAESTRPHAHPLTSEEEWSRLKPYLAWLKESFYGQTLKPLISIDTYHTATAKKAVGWGADLLNDVSGMKDNSWLELLKESDVHYVLMHSLDVPTRPDHILGNNPVGEICNWLEKQLECLEKNNIDLSRVIFDPGIGFGKSALQSLEILKNISAFQKYPVRLLIGHSRKSFLKTFSDPLASHRDCETIGVSLSLIQQGVDILRVHDVEGHIRAFRGWTHARR